MICQARGTNICAPMRATRAHPHPTPVVERDYKTHIKHDEQKPMKNAPYLIQGSPLVVEERTHGSSVSENCWSASKRQSQLCRASLTRMCHDLLETIILYSRISSKMKAQQALIAKAGGGARDGPGRSWSKPDAKTIQDIPDFPIEDSDTFLVPATLATVNVIGEVYNAHTSRYQPDKHLSAYLNDDGGATRMAMSSER